QKQFAAVSIYCKSSVQSTATCDRKANSRLTTALQCYSMFDLRRYGYLVASLINRECIEISETASSDVVCAPRATCRDETASVNSRELQGFRQAEGSGRMESKDLRVHRIGRLHRQVKVQDQSESCLALSPLLVIVSPENTADVTEATDGSGIAREG
ncbi:hypothetical protein ALC62_04583, partial [Cyphomyrmex costatus]